VVRRNARFTQQRRLGCAQPRARARPGKARSRQTSRHLNWWHVSHLDRDGFDYLVCLLFDVNGDVEGAWGLTVAEVRVHAHSTVTGTSGKRTTKLAIRGEWKQHVAKIALSS
jgi:hypothetical protein